MANNVYDAPMQSNAPIPAYKVVVMDGPFKYETSTFDEKTKQIVKQSVQADIGYMVFFPRGHAHMYYSLKALSNAGFSEVVPMINMAGEAEVNKDHQPKEAIVPFKRSA